MNVVWVGSGDAVERRLLDTSGLVDVTVADGLDAAFAAWREDCLGFATAPLAGTLRRADAGDGLATAVGCADCLAFAAGIPRAYAFCTRVGGIVAAVREASGRERLRGELAVLGSGPEAWAALAAFAQLKAAITAYVEPRDAVTGAVAHRMGLDLPTAPLAAWEEGSGAVYDSRSLRLRAGRTCVGRSSILLHTVAAQVRLLTSREPDMRAMRAAARL